MPVYQYEGVHYELPDGLSNEQAISKIEAHLGKKPSTQEKAGIGTGIKSAFANVGNQADTALSTLAGSAAALFGDEKGAVDIEQQMRERIASREEWANPEKRELSLGGKVAGAVGTLPMQVLGMGFSPADTALKAKDAGETNAKAIQAALIDAGGNVAGMLLPGFKQGSALVRGTTGFGANALQDYVTKSLIQDTLETEKGKKTFAPTGEDALVAGIVGAGSAMALGRGKKNNTLTAEEAKLKALKEKQEAINAQKAAETAKTEQPLKNLTSLEDETGQMSLFDQQDMVQNRQPYQAEFGDWRIDENGMPIKADLSMELQNLQQPLQRSLWGDELAPKSEQEAFPITQAIDQMPDAPWRTERDEGLDLLRGEIAAPGELKAAMMEAEGPKIPFNFKKQGGGLDPQVFKEGYVAAAKALSRLTDKLAMDSEWQYRIKRSLGGDFQKNSDGSPMVMLHGTTVPFEGDIRGSAQGIHAGFASSPHMFTMDFNGPKPYLNPKRTKDNANVRPIVIKKGNYPFVPSDIGDWSPERVLKDSPTKGIIEQAFRDKGYSESSIEGLYRYVANQPVGAKRNQAFSDILRRVGIDGFFYKNEGESPKVAKIRALSQKGSNKSNVFNKVNTKQKTWDTVLNKSQDPTSFVTWNDDNIRSVFDYEPPSTIKSPGNKQRGGLLIDPNQKKREIVESVIGKNKNLIPENPDVNKVIEQALQEGKDGKGINLLQSGGTSTAMKRGSAAIEGASRIVQNAVKRAELAIRNSVFPTEEALRKLTREELDTLGKVFKDEMFSNTKFDPQAMADSGFSINQLKAYTAMRQMFDDTLRVQNEARVAKGQKEISAKEAYVSSRWQGDFRRPVFDSEGKLVWYLAADSKLGLNLQTASLLKEFPDLVIDPKRDHVVRSSTGKTDLQSMYSTMLDILGRDDPAIERLRTAIEEQTVAQGSSMLAQEKHFLEKGNVRGFVGDRPGKSAKAETLALFQEQLQYAKNAFKWAEFQKAADDIKKIVGNEALVEQQPNNVKYIRDYWKNAIGYGEAKAVAAIEDSIRDLGMSPQVIKDGVGSIKSYFILQKLAASAGYTAANLIQTTNVLPYMAYLSSQGYKGNPIKALSMGLWGGLAMGTSHYLTAAGGDYKAILKTMPDSDFLIKAFEYAEDNGVTARSVYDESPVETSFSAVGRAANLAGKTMTVPEAFVRATAYMTYVQQLKDSGKFTDDAKIFQKAEELVNKSMVDYRETEKPLIFGKLGTTGNFLNTLQTFPMSFYNQWLFYSKEAAKGNVTPFITALLLQGTIAGAMGIPYADDAYKLYMALKDMLPAKQWLALQKGEFTSDPKLWALKNFGGASVYGVLSDASGIGMTSRIAAPGMGAMLQSPVGPITDIAKQVGNVADAALNPTNTTKLAQAAMSVAPVGLQGALETAPFMEGTTYNQTKNGPNYLRSTDLADRKGGYIRDPKEESLRRWGFRSQKEVVTRDALYSTNRATMASKEKSQSLNDKFYDALRRGDFDAAREANSIYTQLTGKGIDARQIEAQIREEYFTAVQTAKTTAKSLQAMKNIKRLDDLLKEMETK